MTLGLLVASENANKHTRFMFYKYRLVLTESSSGWYTLSSIIITADGHVFALRTFYVRDASKIAHFDP